MKILALLIINPLIVASLLLPTHAFACGFFSLDWLSCFTSPKSVEAEEIDSNSQNMPLLKASVSPSPEASTTVSALAIVGGTSLSSDSQLPDSSKNSASNEDQISLYVVHEGDTLPAVAKMFGVSANTIRWGNNLTGNTLTVGQTLVILPISGIQHVVKAGDTLLSIAKQHKADIDDILQYNNLTKDAKLAVGDIVIVPDGEAASVAPSGGGTSGSMTTPGNSGGTSSSPKVGSVGPNVPVYSGYYLRPIIGGIKTQGIHGHNGVDLASAYGSNILASADGEVLVSKDSGWNGGYGSYIVLKHDNGTQTLYGHLSGTAVSVGDHVTQGQIIGYMGHSGQVTGVTGTHLHFEIRGAPNPF